MSRSSDSGFLLSIIRDKTFQAREIRRVISLSIIYLLVTTAMVGLFYQQLLGNLVEGMAPLLFVSDDMALATDAIPALREVIGRWLIAMLAVNLIITVTLSVFIIRRLGTPILAIKRTLREIGNGNLDVRLRESDNREFSELAAELTKAMRTVREQVAAAKDGIAEVTRLDEHRENVPTDVQQAINDCRNALDYFQVENAENNKAA